MLTASGIHWFDVEYFFNAHGYCPMTFSAILNFLNFKVHDNQLTTLPKEIGELDQLQKLVLR